MSEVADRPLSGKRLLVVEDEYMVACEVVEALEDAGGDVIGPAASVESALELVESYANQIDAAVLDVNLREQRVYPVADVLVNLKVPFIFATGYDQTSIPENYVNVPRCQKPVETAHVVRLLVEISRGNGS